MAEAVPSALVSVAVLLGLLIFHWLAMRNPRDPAVAWLLMPAYALFCLALFAFIWHQRYRTRITALERALRQITVLVIEPGRIAIETSGPYGQQSIDAAIQHSRQLALVRLPEEPGVDRALNGLQIRLNDQTNVLLFPGREIEELQWVLNMLQTFGVQSSPT